MNGDNQLDIIVGNEQSVGIVFMYCGWLIMANIAFNFHISIQHVCL
jgi:hypothetical protein